MFVAQGAGIGAIYVATVGITRNTALLFRITSRRHILVHIVLVFVVVIVVHDDGSVLLVETIETQ